MYRQEVKKKFPTDKRTQGTQLPAVVVLLQHSSFPMAGLPCRAAAPRYATSPPPPFSPRPLGRTCVLITFETDNKSACQIDFMVPRGLLRSQIKCPTTTHNKFQLADWIAWTKVYTCSNCRYRGCEFPIAIRMYVVFFFKRTHHLHHQHFYRNF